MLYVQNYKYCYTQIHFLITELKVFPYTTEACYSLDLTIINSK